MSTLKVILAIATLLSALSMLGLAVFAVTMPHFGLAAVCAMLAAGFGYFSYRDYLFYFGKKNDSQTK